jgi:hypothetical protein
VCVCGCVCMLLCVSPWAAVCVFLCCSLRYCAAVCRGVGRALRLSAAVAAHQRWRLSSGCVVVSGQVELLVQRRRAAALRRCADVVVWVDLCDARLCVFFTSQL